MFGSSGREGGCDVIKAVSRYAREWRYSAVNVSEKEDTDMQR